MRAQIIPEPPPNLRTRIVHSFEVSESSCARKLRYRKPSLFNAFEIFDHTGISSLQLLAQSTIQDRKPHLSSGYEEAIPINPADCDWMSQFAVSFVADIFPKTSRSGTRDQCCRSGLLGRAGSNRFLRDATCRHRTTMATLCSVCPLDHAHC